MRRRFIILPAVLLAALLAPPPPAGAALYVCKGGGKMMFADAPVAGMKCTSRSAAGKSGGVQKSSAKAAPPQKTRKVMVPRAEQRARDRRRREVLVYELKLETELEKRARDSLANARANGGEKAPLWEKWVKIRRANIAAIRQEISRLDG